jgi:hypothetical protein
VCRSLDHVFTLKEKLVAKRKMGGRCERTLRLRIYLSGEVTMVVELAVSSERDLCLVED